MACFALFGKKGFTIFVALYFELSKPSISLVPVSLISKIFLVNLRLASLVVHFDLYTGIIFRSQF